MAAKLLSSEHRNSRQYACGHWGFKADNHAKCLSCRATLGTLCSKSLSCDICEVWDEKMWSDYHHKLQILLVKKAVSWRPQVLSHVNLVLQDGGVIDPSDTDSDADSPPPKKLKNVAIHPPQASSTPAVKCGKAPSCTRGDRDTALPPSSASCHAS